MEKNNRERPAKKEQPDPILAELKALEAKIVPSEARHLGNGELELYKKLPADKKESYLAHIASLRAEEEKKKKKKKAHAARAQVVDTSDLDLDLSESVLVPAPAEDIATAVKKMKQQAAEEIREKIATADTVKVEEAPFEKTIPLAPDEMPFDPHSVPSVDDSKIRADQYSTVRMQEDMDALSAAEQLKPVEKNELGEDMWTPSSLEEQHSAVLGEVYEMYRRDANGPMEFDVIPEEVHQKIEAFFNAHTKNISPTDVIPESEVEAFLTALGASAERKSNKELSDATEERSPAHKEQLPFVMTEKRDDDLEYVSVIPAAFKESAIEDTRRGWYRRLTNLVKKFK